jgi:multiple sugar transport system permease protein
MGLDNYYRIFEDPVFRTSLQNTFFWVAGTLLFPVVLGFVAALGLNFIRGGHVFKVLLFLPYVLSPVVVSVVWSFMYNSSYGAINEFLRAVGLGVLARPWLQDSPTNTFAMIIASTWRMVGTNMVLFLVGLQNLDKDPIEAARLDGASGWRLVRYIILPMLVPMTTVVIVMAIINSLNTFSIIWVMTQGGPYRSSETLAITMYRESFIVFQMGVGSALAVFHSLLVLGASIFYLRVIFRGERA